MAIYRKQALVVGNDSYLIGQLDTCVNDATDVHNCLRSMGFQSRCAINQRLNSIQAITRQFVQSIQPGSIAIFYFSGHGLQYNGINYLIAVDNKGVVLDYLDQTALDVQKLIESMHEKRPRLILVILDCCRGYEIETLTDQRRFSNRASTKIKDGLAPMQAPPGTIIAYACAADQVSTTLSKNNRNSLYTYHLLRHICEPNIDIDLVLRKVAVDVQKDRLNIAHQIPFRYSSCNEIICLVINGGMNLPMLAGPCFRKLFSKNNKHNSSSTCI
jgi:uncharacterized caspase-like protein